MPRHSYPPTARNTSMRDTEPTRAFRPIRPETMAKAKGQATAAAARERRPAPPDTTARRAAGQATAAAARERRPTLPESAAARAREAVLKPRGPATPTAGGRLAGPPKGQATAAMARERRPTLAQSARSSETLNAGKARPERIAPATASDLRATPSRDRYRGLGTRGR